jgi:GTP cyclohydrolase IA
MRENLESRKWIVGKLITDVIGETEREGLADTPARVVKAWEDWTSGYGVSPATVLKTFEDGGEVYNEMVLVKQLPFYSHCEHHLAPFFGTADIAYIPNGRIVGLSKLSRLLDIFAKRLQVQERLTGQVVDALMEHLAPKGAACTIRARHLCMESRGVQKQGHETITNALRGVFLDDHKARGEYLSMVR